MRLRLTIMTAILSLAIAGNCLAATATWNGVAKSNVLVNSKCAVPHYTLAIGENK